MGAYGVCDAAVPRPAGSTTTSATCGSRGSSPAGSSGRSSSAISSVTPTCPYGYYEILVMLSGPRPHAADERAGRRDAVVPQPALPRGRPARGEGWVRRDRRRERSPGGVRRAHRRGLRRARGRGARARRERAQAPLRRAVARAAARAHRDLRTGCSRISCRAPRPVATRAWRSSSERSAARRDSAGTDSRAERPRVPGVAPNSRTMGADVHVDADDSNRE